MQKRFFLWMLSLCFAASLAEDALAQSSVLAKGEFYKFSINKHGVYRLNAADLRAAGLNTATLDPRKLKLYGNVGGVLPQNTNSNRPIDLSEDAIMVIGEEDGKFDENDYVLFYAEGADRYFWNTSLNLMAHEKNFYSDFNYVFLTLAESNGLRVQTSNISGTPNKTIATYNHFEVIDNDQNNILDVIPYAPGGSGRDWYAEKFSELQNEQTYTFNNQGLVANTPLVLTSAVMALSPRFSQFEHSLNGKKLGEQPISSLADAPYARRGNTDLRYFSIVSNDFVGSPELKLNVKYNFDPTQRASFGYMDYVVLNSQREINYQNSQFGFRSMESRSAGLCAYNIQNPGLKNVWIWDVSNPSLPTSLWNSSASNAFTIQTAAANATSLAEIRAFEPSSAFAPVFVEKVANQNLRGLTATDLVIISHPLFLTEAQRLADFRRNNDKLSVSVVTTVQIYNEFSSGRQDVSAIRDFLRMLHRQPNSALKYALLWGDASFDYKDRLTFNTNYVPTYESRESLHPIFSFASDDYFAILGNGEGDWPETGSGGEHDLEIGVGRIPLRDPDQAKGIVDKLIHYETSKTLGAWRNRLAFVADDGDLNAHQIDSESLTKHIGETYKLYNVQKLYMDAYEQVLTTSGKKAKILREKLNQAVQEGALVINYMGHGAEFGWAIEGITDITQINRWRNLDNMPLFVTATCEFGRYDDPNTVSGGEYIMMNPLGGGIAGVVTTRPVFSNTNYVLAEAFYDMIFEPVDGQMPRLGDVLRRTKNKSLGMSNRNFALLGDPSIRLAYPRYEARVTKMSVNGVSSQNVRALDRVRVEGQVFDGNAVLSSFNGTLNAEVFDKPTLVRTLGEEAPVMTYLEQMYHLFKGELSVQNGNFAFEFTAPLDIDYQEGKGKISLYLKDSLKDIDAGGYSLDINVGGSNPNAAQDNTPPTVKLFLNNRAFKNGDAVEAYSTLLADVSDDTGINLAGSNAAHLLVAFLDGEEPIYVLNSHYMPVFNDPKAGVVLFALPKLKNGKHTLTLRVWDVHNNMTEEVIDFEVKDQDIEFTEISVGPNPMTEECYFRIQHNRPGEAMEVLIQFFNMNGQQVNHIRDFYDAAPADISVRFRGKDQDNNFLTRGLYVCRITVHSLVDGATGRATKKLIIQK